MRSAKAGSPPTDPKSPRSTCTWRISCSIWVRKSWSACAYGFERNFDFHTAYYRDQPAGPSRAHAQPRQPELFCRWICCWSELARPTRARRTSSAGCIEWRRPRPIRPIPWRRRWCAALPHDIPPLLHLMQSAEKRNALQKAFKLMERAEQIDGVNAEVRRARLRLLVSMAVRHLREKKPKLAENGIAPDRGSAAGAAGRPAGICGRAALRLVSLDARREAGGRRRLRGSCPAAGRRERRRTFCSWKWSRGAAKSPSSVSRSGRRFRCTLRWAVSARYGDDVGMQTDLFESMAYQMMKELSAPNVSAEPAGTGGAGRSGHAAGLFSAGLRRSPGPAWHKAPKVMRDSCSCGHARCRRGKQERRDQLPGGGVRTGAAPPRLRSAEADRRMAHGDAGLARCRRSWPRRRLDAKEIASVVEREIRERAVPRRPPDFEDADDEDVCQCRVCRAERGQLPPELVEMMEQLGPEAVVEALARCSGIGGKKKRGRRRYPRIDDDDAPILRNSHDTRRSPTGAGHFAGSRR